MYAKAPYTVMQRAVHIHPTVSELLPTMLGDLKPLSTEGQTPRYCASRKPQRHREGSGSPCASKKDRHHGQHIHRRRDAADAGDSASRRSSALGARAGDRADRLPDGGRPVRHPGDPAVAGARTIR